MCYNITTLSCCFVSFTIFFVVYEANHLSTKNNLVITKIVGCNS